MGVMRASVLGVSGKKTQSLIIFIIVLLILLFESTGLLIQSASRTAKDDAYRQIGLYVGISPKESTYTYVNVDSGNGDSYTVSTSSAVITDNMIDDLSAKSHIVGCEYDMEGRCTPVNFHNVKLHTGPDPATQNSQANYSLEEIETARDQICLMGGLNIKYDDRFSKGQNVLTQGQYPDQEHRGAVISEQLADQNGLKVGNVLSLYCNETNKKADIKIIGIYHTNLKFEIAATNYEGEKAYRASPYNTVYTNYDTVSSIQNNTLSLQDITVWADAPQYIQTVVDEINGDKAWDNFTADDMTGIEYNLNSQQLTATANMGGYLTFLSMLFGGIILIIAMTFFANSYMYEAGLYTILGMKKRRILAIQFLQAFIIVFTALIVSLALSPLITAMLNKVIQVNYVPVTSDSQVASFYLFDTEIKPNFHVSITPEIITGMAAALFIMAAVSALIPFLATMRMKPREILAGNKKG